MSINIPAISVVIPTHNRQTSLKRLLDALQAQSYPLEQMEVIVVADGCQDGTVAMLQGYQAPFTLRFIEQPGQGAAVARNQGAACATGRLLLFLDDDIEPSSSLVEAHVSAHQSNRDRVAIGYLPPVLQNQASFFHISLWAWWEDKFQIMRQPGHRYTYDDLLSGNFSVSSELFHRVGGFDSGLRCREDYELGARLIKADAQFTFAADAVGYHRDEVTDLDRSLRRKRQEGKADVLFGRRHPDLMYKLRIAAFGETPWLDWLLIQFIFWLPIVGDLVAAGLRSCLDWLEWLHLRTSWQRLNERLHGYWYLRGVVDELKTYKALLSLLQGGFLRPDQEEDGIELNLQPGLAVAEKHLDESRPKSVRIVYGQQPVGFIPAQPGAERLRGAHLRPVIISSLTSPLLAALLDDQASGLFTVSSPVRTSPETVSANSLVQAGEELHAY